MSLSCPEHASYKSLFPSDTRITALRKPPPPFLWEKQDSPYTKQTAAPMLQTEPEVYHLTQSYYAVAMLITTTIKVTIITLYKTNLSLLCFSASTGSRMNTACSLSQQNRNWSPVKTPGYEASRSNVFLETSALERGTVSV